MGKEFTLTKQIPDMKSIPCVFVQEGGDKRIPMVMPLQMWLVDLPLVLRVYSFLKWREYPVMLNLQERRSVVFV